MFSHFYGLLSVSTNQSVCGVCVCWLQACWTWPPLTVKTAWNVCVSRSSREESLWKTPSPCCLLPYDTTQRYKTHRDTVHHNTNTSQEHFSVCPLSSNTWFKVFCVARRIKWHLVYTQWTTWKNFTCTSILETAATLHCVIYVAAAALYPPEASCEFTLF